MGSWRVNAVVWTNDDRKGRVVTGAFGFAWWEGRRVHVASFSTFSESPLSMFAQFADWGSVKVYDTHDAPLHAVIRFVKTGLLPAQGKLA